MTFSTSCAVYALPLLQRLDGSATPRRGDGMLGKRFQSVRLVSRSSTLVLSLPLRRTRLLVRLSACTPTMSKLVAPMHDSAAMVLSGAEPAETSEPSNEESRKAHLTALTVRDHGVMSCPL